MIAGPKGGTGFIPHPSSFAPKPHSERLASISTSQNYSECCELAEDFPPSAPRAGSSVSVPNGSGALIEWLPPSMPPFPLQEPSSTRILNLTYSFRSGDAHLSGLSLLSPEEFIPPINRKRGRLMTSPFLSNRVRACLDAADYTRKCHT
jgi:hypothetical protein